jgi:phage gp29-like protein
MPKKPKDDLLNIKDITIQPNIDNPNNIDLHMVEFGSSGLNQFGGIIYDENLPELQGIAGARKFREMSENDDIIGAILFLIDMFIRQVDWHVKANADGGKEAQEYADFVESCMSDMSHSWINMISEIMSQLIYGYAPMEEVYKLRNGDSDDQTQNSKYDDGLFGWRKIAVRSQFTIYRWMFDKNGGVQGLEQIAPPNWQNVFIPINKILLFRTKSFLNNPQGRSILRNAYPLWHYKKRFWEILAIGVERDLCGMPVAEVPKEYMAVNASPEKKAYVAAVQRIVRNIRRNEQEGIVWPQEWLDNGTPKFILKLLSTGGRRQFDIDKIITLCDTGISRSCLADFMMLGHGPNGSFSLSSDKTNMFAVAMGSFLKDIAGVFNTDGIPRLLKLNGLDTSIAPTLYHDDLEKPNLAEISQFISSIAGAGVPLPSNVEFVNTLLRMGSLPEIDKNEYQDVVPSETDDDGNFDDMNENQNSNER